MLLIQNLSPKFIFLTHQPSLTSRYPSYSSGNFSLVSPHHRRLLPISISSTHNIICRTRNNKKGISNDDLRLNLRLFMSEVGLPQDHVPTVKELSDHGRYDLAYIVRQRGYKLVTELLTPTMNTNMKGRKENLTGKITDEEVLETNQQDEKTEFADEDLNSDEKSLIPLEPLTKKEKLALSTLQSKAESETGNAKKVIRRRRRRRNAKIRPEDSFSELVESVLLESQSER